MTSFYRNKNVLVTGGGGFLGSHLVERLVEFGAKVRVAQRTDPSINLAAVIGKIEFVPADLSQLQECLIATKSMQIVFDLASKVGGLQINGNQPGTMFFGNSVLGLNMLEAARLEGVERFAYVSSTTVYSPTVMVPNREEDGFKGDPDESNLGYGWAKRVSELGAYFYTKEFGMEIAIVRPANIFGPRDNFKSEPLPVIPALIKRVFQAAEEIDVWGSGDQIRNFVYVKDVVSALMLTAENYAVADSINVSTDEEITINDLINLIMTICGKELRVNFDTSKPTRQIRKAADITKIREKLNWTPSYTLEKGLQETIAWYSEHCRHI